ncbi:conserved hypothetical protein [Histoplasma capsulatum var. duboisii H88]|uniref:Uncharacterized protein n=1 Tax=Ajellomyces capsulatus (strain H88) TaxID=544711 RepID=F0UUI9_AJEC8|nr:conserved hypothetical protein [Histoplasma capsulatum var. duboisii H88]
MVVRWAVSLGSSAVVSMRERDRLELPSKIGEIQYILESDVLQQSDKQYSANDLSATFNQKSINGESVLLAKASNTELQVDLWSLGGLQGEKDPFIVECQVYNYLIKNKLGGVVGPCCHGWLKLDKAQKQYMERKFPQSLSEEQAYGHPIKYSE